MIAKDNDLTKGKRYALVVGNNGQFQEVVYHGRRNDGLARLWPHEFIGGGFNSNDSIMSYRMKEESYCVRKIEEIEVIIPIPDPDGRIFFSNHYVPEFDGMEGGVSREERLELLKELHGAGL